MRVQVKYQNKRKWAQICKLLPVCGALVVSSVFLVLVRSPFPLLMPMLMHCSSNACSEALGSAPRDSTLRELRDPLRETTVITSSEAELAAAARTGLETPQASAVGLQTSPSSMCRELREEAWEKLAGVSSVAYLQQTTHKNLKLFTTHSRFVQKITVSHNHSDVTKFRFYLMGV